MYDGATINGKDNEITNFSFSKSDFSLNNYVTNTTTYKKTQELTSLNLIRCAEFLFLKKDEINQNIENCSKKNLDNIYKELYKRFIIPIYIPLLVLITFILILSSKENLNYSKIKTITFILGLFIIIFSETTIRLISETILKNFLISLMPLALLFILYLIFFSKTNHKYKAL